MNKVGLEAGLDSGSSRSEKTMGKWKHKVARIS